MVKVIVPFGNGDVNSEPDSMALHSDHVIPKMLPEHYDEIEYTFTEEPLNNTAYEMFSIPFDDFNYVPMAHVLMQTPKDLNPGGNYAFLVTYTLGISIPYIQQIYMRIERDKKRLAVYYSWTNTVAPSYTVNGKTFKFRYYIYVEGDDDPDFVEISKTL